MVDWTVQRNLKLWRTVFAELDAHTARLRESGALAPHGDTEFQYNREELFARLREPVERRLDEFDTEREAFEAVIHARYNHRNGLDQVSQPTRLAQSR